jgi:hypothetical protein
MPKTPKQLFEVGSRVKIYNSQDNYFFEVLDSFVEKGTRWYSLWGEHGHACISQGRLRMYNDSGSKGYRVDAGPKTM